MKRQTAVRRVGSVRGGARRAFTLIEVMIVIAIVLALSGLVAVSLFQRRDEAKTDLVKIDLNTLRSAIKQFRFDFERWPTDEEGLRVLWDKEALDPEADQSKWKAYLEEPMPTDRWDTEWGYRQVGELDETMYDLWSNGPDKEEGTEDDIVAGRSDADAEGGSGFIEAPSATGGN